MVDPVSPSEFLVSEGVEDWRLLSDGANAYFETGTFGESARFVQAISALPGVEGRPPDVDVRPGGVTVRLDMFTAEYVGLTTSDLELARQISALARSLGLASDPSRLQSLLVVPGASDVSAVMPFWRAALGYVPRPDSPEEDLVDPQGRGAPFWFETMQEPRPGGGGAIHLAVWLPPEEAEARVAAALGAGGHVVRDTFAPSWWTLADSAGNEVDVSSVAGRG